MSALSTVLDFSVCIIPPVHPQFHNVQRFNPETTNHSVQGLSFPAVTKPSYPSRSLLPIPSSVYSFFPFFFVNLFPLPAVSYAYLMTSLPPVPHVYFKTSLPTVFHVYLLTSLPTVSSVYLLTSLPTVSYVYLRTSLPTVSFVYLV